MPKATRKSKKAPTKAAAARSVSARARSRAALPDPVAGEDSSETATDSPRERARRKGRSARAAPGDDAIRRFESRYELLGEIGSGGMGVVFKAYDRELDEVIALKSLVEAVRTNPERIARFKNEIKLARKLSHPNIARVHDLVEVHGRLCLSMAFIEGRSLDKIIRESGPLPASRVLRYVSELCPALALAHDSGVVHRDIKPANIIVDADDSTHIVDFGIAASGSDSSVARVGTPVYMAPECWLAGKPGVSIDSRCDLYALGITLYEMVCGHVPFWNRSLATLMEMHCERTPRRPQAIAPGVPDALDSAIMRLLEKEPEARFQKASEVLEVLDPSRQRLTPAARSRPPGTVPPILKPPGSRGKILLADGDRSVLKQLAERIRAHDFVVIDADDGVQAMEKSFLELPDLILLDAQLGVLDVLDVIRLLKKDERTHFVPVVVLSGLPDPDYEALARDVGAAAYFVKPIPPAVLDLLIGRYFG